MKKRTRMIAAGATALVAAGGATGVAKATGGDTDAPITGDARQQAERVALAQVGSGRVTATEAGDEEGYYQVEVTKDDGTQTDVNLDKSFNVVKVKTEHAD